MQQPQAEDFKLRVPREGEIVGHVEALQGAKRLIVKCADGKTRMCRVPGKLKKIWIREDDYVLVVPWEIEGDKKADIIWRYKRVEVENLIAKGLIPKNL